MERMLAALLALLALPVVALGQGQDARTFIVEVEGNGPPMILLPGLTSPGAVWRHTYRPLPVGLLSSRYHACRVRWRSSGGRAVVGPCAG
jgi:pimeloyl-ACP methyl ester carboxylesterase